MRRISYQDIQYCREGMLYGKLSEEFDKLRERYSDLATKVQQIEENFLELLSHSIKIDRLDHIAALIQRVNRRLQTNFPLNVFLCEFPTSQALCIPRYVDSRHDRDELTVIVSQHFLNNLCADEQAAILGHELAHMMFGHVEIPANAVLESPFDFGDVQELKAEILKWKTCCEITCDVSAFISCGCDADHFSAAMLKFCTGLSDGVVDSVSKNVLVDLLLQQYDDISQSMLDSVVTTHPLTPLRLKIIRAIEDAPLVKNYGVDLDDDKFRACHDDFNKRIDDLVVSIYPEIISDREFEGDQIVFEMSVAVALADGQLENDELEAIGKITGGERDLKATRRAVAKQLKGESHESLVKRLVTQSVRKTRSQDFVKSDVVKMVRQLIVVASSDGHIQKEELETIFEYSREFDVGKREIAFLAKQMGLA